MRFLASAPLLGIVSGLSFFYLVSSLTFADSFARNADGAKPPDGQGFKPATSNRSGSKFTSESVRTSDKSVVKVEPPCAECFMLSGVPSVSPQVELLNMTLEELQLSQQVQSTAISPGFGSVAGENLLKFPKMPASSLPRLQWKVGSPIPMNFGLSELNQPSYSLGFRQMGVEPPARFDPSFSSPYWNSAQGYIDSADAPWRRLM
jgi:hypothetical protein